MKLYPRILLTAVLALPAFCQKPSPFPEPVPMAPEALQALKAQALDLDSQTADLQAQAATMSMDAKMMAADKAFSEGQIEALSAQAAMLADKVAASPFINMNLSVLTPEGIAQMKAAAADMANDAQMAFLQGPTPRAAAESDRGPRAVKVTTYRGRDDAYNAGTRALDDHKYDEAVQRFDSAIQQDPSRADGALYWKAYALNRQGKRDEALAAIAQLRRDYASSAWLHDAQALEAEVKQGNGQPVSPGQESNDDLKLLAINGLMNADAERALPLVEGILKGNSGPSVKDRALFVISQNKSPRAQQALLDYAKGGGNPDLQLRAIQYVGMSGTKDAQQQLVGIYTSSSDVRVKNAIIQALMIAHASDSLLNIAKSEKDSALRGSAIRDLVMSRGVSTEGLAELYSTSDAASKREIINGLMARGDGKTLVDMARKETDPAMKKNIVERLSNMHDNKDAMDYMMELLK